MCLVYFLTYSLRVYVQPGTSRPPVDWCRNYMSVLYQLQIPHNFWPETFQGCFFVIPKWLMRLICENMVILRSSNMLTPSHPFPHTACNCKSLGHRLVEYETSQKRGSLAHKQERLRHFFLYHRNYLSSRMLPTIIDYTFIKFSKNE